MCAPRLDAHPDTVADQFGRTSDEPAIAMPGFGAEQLVCPMPRVVPPRDPDVDDAKFRLSSVSSTPASSSVSVFSLSRPTVTAASGATSKAGSSKCHAGPDQRHRRPADRRCPSLRPAAIHQPVRSDPRLSSAQLHHSMQQGSGLIRRCRFQALRRPRQSRPAEPDDDPPGMSDGSSGLTGVPNH